MNKHLCKDGIVCNNKSEAFMIAKFLNGEGKIVEMLVCSDCYNKRRELRFSKIEESKVEPVIEESVELSESILKQYLK